MKRMALMLVALVGLGVSASGLAAKAPILPGLWKVLVRIEVVGVPAGAVPERTYHRCLTQQELAKYGGVPKPVHNQNMQCRMLKVNRHGKQISWAMSCKGRDNVRISGVSIFESTTSYRETIHIKGTAAGRPLNVTQHIRAHRLGQCKGNLKD